MGELQGPPPEEVGEIPEEKDLLPRVTRATVVAFHDEMIASIVAGTDEERNLILDKIRRENPEIAEVLLEFAEDSENPNQGTGLGVIVYQLLRRQALSDRLKKWYGTGEEK